MVSQVRDTRTDERSESRTWVSMSKMHIFPPFLTSSTALTLVPYMLPLNSACSMKPSALTRSRNWSRVTKWYEVPFSSPGRGARVVSDGEKSHTSACALREWMWDSGTHGRR